ncbi:glycosyltransferase [Hoeflea sp.]|uniref:glycosyltransferase n=1 Tax=Hoeflea sp. TaxID=1940281 RepID=UPI003B529DEC
MSTENPSDWRYRKTLSVVLPTYNEIKNIPHVVGDIAAQDVDGRVKRVIFVDDNSSDGTADFVKSMQDQAPFDIVCIERIGRVGLSSAITEGIMAADTELVAVMDCDGQHKARDLFTMLDTALNTDADIVLGSRFKTVRSQESHQGLRQWLSQTGIWLANKVIGQELSDPLTGFFLVKRSGFREVARLTSNSGFKIVLDYLFHHRREKIRVEEVQISFEARHDGESKLDSRILLEFADQIVSRLSHGLIPERFVLFSLTGTLGIAVHMLAVYLLYDLAGVPFRPAILGATLAAMVFNFSLNNLITFRRFRLKGRKWFRGLVIFVLVCSIGAAANVGVAGYLNDHDSSWQISALAGVFVGTVFNFGLARRFVWKN